MKINWQIFDWNLIFLLILTLVLSLIYKNNFFIPIFLLIIICLMIWRIRELSIF